MTLLLVDPFQCLVYPFFPPTFSFLFYCMNDGTRSSSSVVLTIIIIIYINDVDDVQKN